MGYEQIDYIDINCVARAKFAMWLPDNGTYLLMREDGILIKSMKALPWVGRYIHDFFQLDTDGVTYYRQGYDPDVARA